MHQGPRDRTKARIVGVCSLWLCWCFGGCTESALIGGLCPPGCVLELSAGSCACKPKPVVVADAGPCMLASCAAEDDAGLMCSAGRQALTRQRLDLIIVVNNATSVSPWWAALTQGFSEFVNDDQSNGIGVGLQVFGDDCDPQQYAVPLVPIAVLPGNASALQAALPITASLVTSTVPTLTGTLQYARDWTTSHADSLTAAVLLTDASPGVCDGLSGDYIAAASQLARDAYQASPSIATYVIGIGVSTNVDTLASAGGTEAQAISTLPPDGEVLSALQKVRDGARPCAFAWPIDYTLAPDSEVIVRAADGGEQHYAIQRVSAACDHDGYYMLDETAFYPLMACPRTCAALAPSAALSLSSTCLGSQRP
jgi:hypothetical protein